MVSTAEGVTGQRQGFNISTAESAFLANTQNQVNEKIKAVEDQKAAAINAGNLDATNKADNDLAKLQDFNVKLTLAKANYALQLMSGARSQAQLDLTQQRGAFQNYIDTHKKKKKITITPQLPPIKVTIDKELKVVNSNTNTENQPAPINAVVPQIPSAVLSTNPTPQQNINPTLEQNLNPPL